MVAGARDGQWPGFKSLLCRVLSVLASSGISGDNRGNDGDSAGLLQVAVRQRSEGAERDVCVH